MDNIYITKVGEANPASEKRERAQKKDICCKKCTQGEVKNPKTIEILYSIGREKGAQGTEGGKKS